MRFRTGIIFVIMLTITSCEKAKYYPDSEYNEVATRIIAHRTGGGGSSPYQENSLAAAKESLKVLDGIEADIQISRDGNLWLGYSADLPDCGEKTYTCFYETTDDQIRELDACDGDSSTYCRLEEIFALISSTCPDKFISLDVKGWIPCSATRINLLAAMNALADEIIRLTEKYNLQQHVMVESEALTFLSYLKNNSAGIDCYLLSYGDFEQGIQTALEFGYSGISFKYKSDDEITEEHIRLLRRKGLKIQLWTVNSEENINEAISINPDFIQTDNLEFF